jgi:hypothetical protein
MKNTKTVKRGLYIGKHSAVNFTKAFFIKDRKDAVEIIGDCLTREFIDGTNYLLLALKKLLEEQK